jgi:hypothetical protein
MPAASRIIVGLIVFTAIGFAQLVGISRGFWCDCLGAPKLVAAASCLAAECHPAHDHDHDHGCAELAVVHDECGDRNGGSGGSGCDHDHEHHEVRDSLKGAAVAGVLSVPAPTVYDLPPSLQLASFRLGVSADKWVVRPGFRTDSGPPAPHAAVRTVVMRI